MPSRAGLLPRDPLDGVTRRRLRLDETGVEIALLDWGGDGPLALLHHANGFCAGVWGLVAERLRPHFRLVAMDARGHGDSSKPEGAGFYRWENFGRDVAAVGSRLVRELGAERIALGLGHSFGGTSILMASGLHPGLFARAVLVDPVIFSPAEAPPEAQRAERGPSLAEQARRRRVVWPDRETAREAWRGKDLFTDWDPRALELYLAEGLADRPDGRVELKCPGEVEATIFDSGRGFDVWPLAARSPTATLLLRASRGNFPAPLYARLAARMQHARVEELDAGHLAPMERPDLVAEAVLAFTGMLEG